MFCQNFLRKCVLASSKGMRNNQKKIISSFWDISKNRIFFSKKMKKSPKNPNCSKLYEKNKICIFSQNFVQKCVLTSSKGTRKNQKKISSSFRDISKIPSFFLADRPVRPSVRPSIQAGGDAWYPGGFYRMPGARRRLAAQRCLQTNRNKFHFCSENDKWGPKNNM